MNFIKQNYEVCAETGLDIIERAGRCCYQSESKENVTTDAFVRSLIARGHESVIEHAWFCANEVAAPCNSLIREYGLGSQLHSFGNARMWRDAFRAPWYSKQWAGGFLSLSPTLFDDVLFSGDVYTQRLVRWADKWVKTVRIVCDRGVSHEIVRHRLVAYSQESTRFCNYAEGCLSSNGITLIHPPGLSAYQLSRRERHFWDTQALYDAEIGEGVKPQIARGVLPTCLKTELYMTCDWREWQHIFKLRDHEKAHPQMRELMEPLHDALHPWIKTMQTS